VLQSIEDIPESVHNNADEGRGSEREDCFPNKPVSINSAKLAPLGSISEVALDSYN